MERPTLVRRAWFAGGMIALATGTIGIALPLLPTVPFYILAAFCFGKSNPVWEARMLAHPRFGPHIMAWRERGAISRFGKVAAITMLTGSAIGGWFLLPGHWAYVPAGIAIVCGSWIATRPS